MRSSYALLQRRHWIFDLDGTLTVAVHDFPSLRRLLDIPPEADILDFLARLPAHEANPRRERLDVLEIALAKQSKPAQGAFELVRTLHKRGFKMGILTRNTRENAQISLNVMGMGDFFPSAWILGRHEAKPKPHPEGIYQLLEYWQATPEEAVMVGDYVYDLQTGRAAGTATVHVDVQAEFVWRDLMDVGVTTLAELQGYL